VSDRYGERLLELCKSVGLYILNGRVGSDKGVGNTTCKDASVVDYVIGSAGIFHHVKSFQVLSFNSMLSDCHNPIQIKFKNQIGAQNDETTQYSTPKNTMYRAAPRRPKWEKESKQIFLDNLEKNNITDILAELSLCENHIEDVTPDTVDKIVKDLCDIFDNRAKKSGFI
jgi:hypothetical protein